jgi:hypothetical protein
MTGQLFLWELWPWGMQFASFWSINGNDIPEWLDYGG